MDMVEIGDDAMCFDDPISLETYILVTKNALLIPSMGHIFGKLASSLMKFQSIKLLARPLTITQSRISGLAF